MLRRHVNCVSVVSKMYEFDTSDYEPRTNKERRDQARLIRIYDARELDLDWRRSACGSRWGAEQKAKRLAKQAEAKAIS